MRSRFRHSVRRLVIPILVVGILSVGVIRTLESGLVPGPYASICMAPQFASESPPADLMVIGSSRTVQGIDPDLIKEQLLGSSVKSVEKVVILGSNEIMHGLALRTYLEERGAPRILGIELGFERNRSFDSVVNFYQPMPLAPAVFTASAYKNQYKSLMAGGNFSIWDSLFRSEVDTPVEFALQRFDIGLSKMLRQPSSALDLRHNCDRVDNFLNSRYGFAKPLPSNPVPMSAEQRARMSDNSSKIPPFDNSDAWTQKEISVLKDMVHAAKEAGVEHVFIYLIPTFNEPPSRFNPKDLFKSIEELPFFDGRRTMQDPTQPLLADQFLNLHHVNRFGAYAISTDLAEFVTELIS